MTVSSDLMTKAVYECVTSEWQSTTEIANDMGISMMTARRHLRRLHDLGKVEMKDNDLQFGDARVKYFWKVKA